MFGSVFRSVLWGNMSVTLSFSNFGFCSCFLFDFSGFSFWVRGALSQRLFFDDMRETTGKEVCSVLCFCCFCVVHHHHHFFSSFLFFFFLLPSFNKAWPPNVFVDSPFRFGGVSLAAFSPLPVSWFWVVGCFFLLALASIIFSSN